jgi:HAD superfamily hydrolase (TIGR01509 family)
LTIAILWDLDGVVADTGEAHFAAWQKLFAERGETITREQFEETFGMSNTPILKRWVGEDAPAELIAELARRKEELFRQEVEGQVRILPGVRAWLEQGRERGYRQVIASSGPMANIVAIVSALDIGDYFDALVSGAFLPNSKPSPAIFLQAAGAAGATPDQSLVIEDGTVGVEAARRAGMRCVAVTTTHDADKLSAADLVVDRLDALDADAFERLLG